MKVVEKFDNLVEADDLLPVAAAVKLPIKLPIDADTNQFAIIRPMDPKRSRELSFLDTFMVAIMKEAKVKANETTAAEQRRRGSGSPQ